MRKHFFVAYLISSLGLGVAVTAQVREVEQNTDDQWYCSAARHEEVMNDQFAQLSPCGSECPDVVKHEATVKPVSECPIDGWLVYGAGFLSSEQEPVYVRRLKASQSEAIDLELPEGSFWFRWSPNGEWITYQVIEGVSSPGWIVKRDGSVNVPLTYTKANGDLDTIREQFVNWYRSSPYEEPEKDIYEIVWGGAHKLFGILVDLSGETPVVLSETRREIGKKLGWHTQSGTISVGKDIIVWDERVKMAVDWIDEVQTGEPTTVYTIPDGGKGMAGRDDIYPVYGLFNCGSELSWDAEYLIHNPGRLYADCIPNGHHGFGILRPKRKDEPLCTIRQWWLEKEHGAVSVNWAPRELGGKEQWTAHGGNGKYSNWGDWNFSNVPEWITGHNDAGKAPTEAYGGWVIHWPTHEWYKYTEDGAIGWWAGLYIDEGVNVEERRAEVVEKKLPSRNRLPQTGSLVDIRGRQVAPGAGTLKRGVYIDTYRRSKTVHFRTVHKK